MADLTTVLNSNISTAIGVAVAGSTTQNVWTAHDTTACTWNSSNVFLNAVTNKSCIAFKQNPSNTFAAHMTIISLHHAICAAHVAPNVGASIYAYTEAGVVVTTTVSAVEQIAGSDICIITLTGVMTNVQVARFFPNAFEQYIHKTSSKVYLVFMTQDEKMFVGYTTGNYIADNNTFIYFTSDAADTYYSYYQPQRGGDSSSGLFAIKNGFLCILESAYGANYGACYDDWITAIQAILTRVTGETLTFVDMSDVSTVSDPAVYIAPPSPSPPLPLSAVPTITKRIGVGGDYATLPLFVADLDNNYTQQANYVVSLIGGSLLAGTTIQDSDIIGGAAGSSLTIIADTANVVAVSSLIQTDTAGQTVVRGTTLSSTAGSVPIRIAGVQIGSSTSNGLLSVSSLSTASPFVAENIFIRVITTGNPITLTASSSGLVTLQNAGILANNSTSATQVMLNIAAVSGEANFIIRHVSNHVLGLPLGFMKLTLVTGQVMNLELTNIIATSTNSTYKLIGSIGLSSGAATLNLTARGIRCGAGIGAGGTLDLTGILAAGIIVNQTCSDLIGGLTSTNMFVSTTNGLNILSNNTTVVSTAISPTSLDLTNNARPQISTILGTQKVFAGFANPLQLIDNFSVAVSGSDLVVTWTSHTDVNHYVAIVNGTTTDPATSPFTIVNGVLSRQTITVKAQDGTPGNTIRQTIYNSILTNYNRLSPFNRFVSFATASVRKIFK